MAIPKRPLRPSEVEIRGIADGTLPLDAEVGKEAAPRGENRSKASISASSSQVPVPSATPSEVGESQDEGSADGLRGNKKIITAGFNPRFLDHIDYAASMLNINRTAFLNLAATHLVRATYREHLERLDSRPAAAS